MNISWIITVCMKAAFWLSMLCSLHLSHGQHAVLQGGYETTASALGFTIYNLAANPDKAAKLMKVRTSADTGCHSFSIHQVHSHDTCMTRVDQLLDIVHAHCIARTEGKTSVALQTL